MALADTAALVASLELKDKFTATANKFDRAVGGIDKTISRTATNIGRLGAIGFGLLAGNVALGIQSLVRLEEVTTATSAVIESTGGVAGISADKVRELAEQYENLNATMDDKVIQSAENVLLTFTAIGEEAFPLALEAALNMNQALGGGEEGLQGTIIQVGKALQDPIRGITALRRVGVNFTTAQQKQIRALVEANDLFGAQQLILRELGTEFGGQFARAGDTAAARFAKFKDTIEDTQMTLASAFLPALERVSDKLTTLLADPATQAAISELGTNLADAFDALVEVAGNLPWESIGNAFKLMGTGSKALLDAFLGLPPWVQTAVLTGWGLNKLTGGALTGIVGTLASGLIKGILGINAGVVNINAATVNGGVPGTGAPTGGGGLLGTLGAAAGTAGIFAAIAGGFAAIGDLNKPETAGQGIAALTGGPAALIANAIESVIGNPIDDLLTEDKKLSGRVSNLNQLMNTANARQAEAQAKQSSDAARQLQSQAASLVSLQQIAAKPPPTVNVRVNTSISVSNLQRVTIAKQIASGGPTDPFRGSL